MRQLLPLILAALLCEASAAMQAFESNIPYRTAEETASDPYLRERSVLDIAYPRDSKGAAVIVWFHGGGLTGGQKYVPGELRNRGYCVVAPNYRLSPRVPAEKAIEDAAAAIAWVFANIEGYGGSTDRIFVSGASAGGYLTLMTGLDRRWLKRHGIEADRIAGLIPFSGQAITHFAIRGAHGIPPERPVVDEFAPLYHVRPDAPPLLLITGDRELELLGRYEENAYLARMMRIAGHRQTRLVELGGYDHGGMEPPAHPLLIQEVERILRSRGAAPASAGDGPGAASTGH